MIRRLTPVVGALACTAALASVTACSTVSANDVAASVEDGEISRDVFEEYLRAGADGSDVVPGDSAASQLTQFVYGQAIRHTLDATAVELTQDDRDGYTSQLAADDDFFTFSSELQTALLYNEAGPAALARVPAPSLDEIEARYTERPASIGLACYETVTVASSGRATEIVEQVRDGVALADAAGEGAQIGGTGAACTTFDQLWDGLEQRPVIDALIDARPGAPAVVDVEDGWVVVDVLPFDAVRETVEANVPQAPGAFLTIGLLVTGDITVDPAYGRWDPAAGVILTS